MDRRRLIQHTGRRMNTITLILSAALTLLLLSYTHDSSSDSSSSSSSSSSSLLLPVSATYVSGHMYTTDTWKYLAKFCFDEAGGMVNFVLREDGTFNPGSQKILFYADQEDSWPAIYGSSLSCQQKVDKAKASLLISSNSLPELQHTTVTGIIPRWWYIAVSNCDAETTASNEGDAIKISQYNIHFTNSGGLWIYEFSKDVQGVLEMSIFFLVIYWCMLFLLAWIKEHAKSKGMQYTVVKFVFASMLVEWIALLFLMSHYAKFAHDGVGVPGLEKAHFFFEFISNLILLYAVVNVCKGWAISTNFIPDKRQSYVSIFCLFVFYIALFGWTERIMDPASVLYIYETPPGWTIVGIHCGLTVYAIWSVFHTYRLETVNSKRQFYIVWLFFATCWLASLPIIVGIAHSLPSWKRRRVVFGLTNSVQCAMYIVLTYLFRPFRSNRYVDILSPDESRAFGNNHMQVFPGPAVEFSSV